MTDVTCTIGTCAKPVFASGLCTTHYSRRRTHGDANYQPPERAHDLTGRRFGLLTVLRKEGKRWICRCDCGSERTCTAGGLNAGHHAHCGNRTFHGRTQAPSYRGIHTRLQTARGAASTHPCVDCGQQAQHWSYDYNDPEQVYGRGHRSPYSVHLEHYQPRCVPCHGRFDYGRPGDKRNRRG